jgi:hypothetical protein
MSLLNDFSFSFSFFCFFNGKKKKKKKDVIEIVFVIDDEKKHCSRDAYVSEHFQK